MSPQYPVPWKIVCRMSRSIVLRQKAQFSAQARDSVKSLQPPLRVLGRENIPVNGSCLVTSNHYSRPGFHAWWVALAISASVPFEIHWIITQAWRFENSPFAWILTPATRWLLKRIAQVFDFTDMPPMPPDPAETEARARAVSRALEYARHTDRPAVGLVPEGRDFPGGVLGPPPDGVGRFIILLNPFCKQILPAGVYEEGNELNVNFGETYTLNMETDNKNKEGDRLVSQKVMQAIARLLPQHLRGVYQSNELHSSN
jgi:hypothetical protein